MTSFGSDTSRELTVFGSCRRVSPPVLGATCTGHGRGACAAGGEAPPGATRWQLRRQLALPIAAIAFATGLLAIDAQEHSPWFGTWQQIPPTTKWFNPWPYQKVTLRIEPQDDGLRVVYDMVRRRGGITHMEWSGRLDGRDYPVQGVDYVLTNAYRTLSDRSYQILVRVDGRQAAIATAAVSADGSRMTVDTVEMDGRRQIRRTQAVYLRQK